jgi:hypothetical protein
LPTVNNSKSNFSKFKHTKGNFPIPDIFSTFLKIYSFSWNLKTADVMMTLASTGAKDIIISFFYPDFNMPIFK